MIVASTPPMNTRTVLVVSGNSPAGMSPVCGVSVTGPSPLHHTVITPPIAAGWFVTPGIVPSGCAHESWITSSPARLKLVTIAREPTAKMPGEA